MEPSALPRPPVVWLVTEDMHLIRADTITTIGVTSDQITVWQGDRATTVVQATDGPRLSTSYAGLLAAQLATASSQLDQPHPLVYVWFHLDGAKWQIAVKGGDPPQPPFSAEAPD